MRRAEKKVQERDQIEAIIAQARVCRLGMIDNGVPYVVPLNFGYCDGTLYFHSAHQGRKVDILKTHPRVCFEMDVDLGIRKGDTACRWGARYRSLIGYGTVAFLEGLEEKVRALDIIMAQYSDENHVYLEESVRNTLVFKLTIDEIEGKQSE